MDRIPRQGEFYRHFKNKLYQIVAVARHTETGEQMVVYQALYGDFSIFVRPLKMFIGEVDREKYPDAVQKYRFELVEPGHRASLPCGPDPEPRYEPESCGKEERVEPEQWYLRFLEANSATDRLKALDGLGAGLTQEMLDGMYEVLDMRRESGNVQEQMIGIRKYLQTQRRYDGVRLR